ncbi:MAG: bis(5'-nucleosyl)-tetraphosphatase (symmetrical) YqeK [Clostridia bacterium]|nr:bis(5'-nucleosyl)-tetraphosphatase (symmetrical) YqeK [Clostridia bacterium]
MKKQITEEQLQNLRKTVSEQLSPKRAYHTLCVEQMVARLSELFCPEKTMTLRAAALLHDITKEKSTKEQEALCKELGIVPTLENHFSPKTYHAITAASLIEREYPDFADEKILSAVRWHTTGHAGMTLAEKLLYLADYIDESREYENCVALRKEFFDANPESMNMEEREKLLCRVLIHSYRLTMEDLLSEGRLIAKDTVEAYNELLIEQATHR